MVAHRFRCVWSLALVPLFCWGCGGGADLVPVSGKVKSGTELLNTGTVTLSPDKSKGNTSDKTPIGAIGEDGTYTLATGGKPGAPAGWYKVTVVAEAPRAKGKSDASEYAVPVYLVADDYMDPDRTPLAVEVKPGAPEGHYNLELAPRPR